MQRRSLAVVALCIAFMASKPVFATQYYVNAETGSDQNDGLSVETPWRTIAKVNSSSFSPGDRILLRAGQIWRERLVVPSSGTADNPFEISAFGAGDRPTLSGAIGVAGWQQVNGSVFRAALAVQPHQVFSDSARLVREWGPAASIGVGEWAWSSGFVYVNVGSHPSGFVIEATPGDGSASYGAFLIDKDFVVIDGLHITRFRTNVFVTGEATGSSHATVRNCRISDGFLYGVHGWDDAHPNDDVTITGNLIEHNGSAGVKWTRFGRRGVISYNEVYGNGQLTDEETGDPEHDYRAGISLWGDGEGIEDIVVEHNDVAFTGMGRQPIDGDGNGIWVDRTLGGNIIRYNVVRSSARCGIIIEDVPLGGMIYYNVSVNNGGVLEPTTGFGLLLMRGSEFWEVYNNTVFGNANGLGMGNWIGDGIPDNNTVINNIVFSSGTREIHVVHGAEVLSNEFELNFIEEGPGFVKWGSTLFGLLGSWESAAPQADNNATGEPGFVDPATGDFRLIPGSPCLDAGIDVGLEFDIEGMPVVGTPTVGAYENPFDPFALPFTDGFESGDLCYWPDSLP